MGCVSESSLALNADELFGSDGGVGTIGARLLPAAVGYALFELAQRPFTRRSHRLMIGAAATGSALALLGLGVRPETYIGFAGLCVVGIAATSLIRQVRRRVVTADVLSRLSLTVGSVADVADLRAALAWAVSDETVSIQISPDGKHDRNAMTVELTRAGRRARVEIYDGGTHLATVSFDAALARHTELVDLIGIQTRDALRRLHVTEQLEHSRSRIAVAAAQERARIERDLHDGAQQRLVGLRIRLAIIEEQLGTDRKAGERALHELGPELDRALDELRALAHGIYPSALADHGLDTALRGLAFRSPLLPVYVSTRGLRRHAGDVESALYFTCVEALQNAIKHAEGATAVWISVRDDRALALEVHDDGPGFVPQPTGFSRGLRNMADRIEAIGGRLEIDSKPGRGTRVTATVTVD